MIVIGDPGQFAVGLELDAAGSAKPWMYGKFTLWTCGRELGDAAAEVTLSDVLVSSKSLAAK